MTRQSPYVIELSATDRAVLEKRARTYTARHADVIRAKIVLLCADGHPNTAIATRLGVHVSVVRTWRKRFFEAGLDGLADRPRRGRPRSLPKMTEAGVTDRGSVVELEVPQPRRSSEQAAPAGQLICFESRYKAAAAFDALRHLVSSINRYLAEADAGHARHRAGVRAPTRR